MIFCNSWFSENCECNHWKPARRLLFMCRWNQKTINRTVTNKFCSLTQKKKKNSKPKKISNARGFMGIHGWKWHRFILTESELLTKNSRRSKLIILLYYIMVDVYIHDPMIMINKSFVFYRHFYANVYIVKEHFKYRSI